jgi:hypothetical protein
MPPQPTTLHDTLDDTLDDILIHTIAGVLAWEAARNPQDGEVLFYKAMQPEGEFVNTYRLNPEEGDGGPSLGVAFGNHPLDPDDDLILRDHLPMDQALQLQSLMKTVQART